MAGERGNNLLARMAGRVTPDEAPAQIARLRERLQTLEAMNIDLLSVEGTQSHRFKIENLQSDIISLGIKNSEIDQMRNRITILYEHADGRMDDLANLGKRSASSLADALRAKENAEDEHEGVSDTHPQSHIPAMLPEKAPGALAQFKRPRYWDRGAGEAHPDTREPLPIEQKAVDALYAVLRDIEAKPERIDGVVKDITAKLSALSVDKQFRGELRELARIMGGIQRRIEGRGKTPGMENEEIRRHAGQFLDALERVEKGRPLSALPEENIFREVYLVETLTKVLPAIADIARQIAEEGESAYKIRPIRQFKGPVRQGLYYGALALTGGTALASFAFAGTGLRNFVINFLPYAIPFKDTIREYMNSKGLEADSIGVDLAQRIGFSLALASTGAMIFYRSRHNLNLRQWILLLTGTTFLLGGATAGLFEKAVNAGDTGKMGAKVGEAAGGMKTAIATIPDRLKDTKDKLVAGAGKIVEAEAADGGPGPKTMFYIITYLATATPEQLAAFEKFIKEKDPSGKFARDLENYKAAFKELAASENYKPLGLSLGKVGVKQVIERAFATISPKEAVDMFENLLKRGEAAAKTSLAGHMLGELDLFSWFGSHDDTLSLGLYKDSVFRKFRGIIKDYEAIDTRMELLVSFLRDLTLKTGVNMLGKSGGKKPTPAPGRGKRGPSAPPTPTARAASSATIDQILNLPSLGITDKHLENADKQIGQAVVKSAFHIFLTTEGRAELGEAMRNGTMFKDFNENDAMHITAMGAGFFFLYGLVDLGPGIVIERANRRTGRRFKVEASQKFNEAYKVESTISRFIAKHVSGTLGAASTFLDLKNLGLEYGLPEEIIAVRVRHNLQKMACEELPELQESQRKRKGFVIDKNSPITAWDPRSPISWAEAFLGVNNDYHSPDAKMANAKINWLRGIEEHLKKGDGALIERLTSDVAPQYAHIAPGLFSLLKKKPDDLDYAEQKDLLSTEVLSMRRKQLEVIAQDMPRHIALLRAAQERIIQSTSLTENKAVALLGKGNLSFSPDYIKQTFLLNRIADDIEELEDSYATVKELGIRVEHELGETLSGAFLGNSADISWRPSSSAEQAALDEIIRTNERRVLELTEGLEKKDLQTFSEYMNAIDMGLKPVIEMFRRDLPPALQGRSAITLIYDYNKEEGAPTISVALLDTPRFLRKDRLGPGATERRVEGVPEIIASVPFNKFPIPDLSGEMADPQNAIEELTRWLSPHGEAIRAMEAHVRRREIIHLLADLEDGFAAERPEMTYKIPDELEFVDSKGNARNRLADFAYLKALRGWQVEIGNLFSELSPSGQIYPRASFSEEDLSRIESIYSKALVGASYAIEDARLIDTAIQFAIDNIPPGYELLYDMKTDTPEIIVHAEGQEDTRIPINMESRKVLELFRGLKKA